MHVRTCKHTLFEEHSANTLTTRSVVQFNKRMYYTHIQRAVQDIRLVREHMHVLLIHIMHIINLIVYCIHVGTARIELMYITYT